MFGSDLIIPSNVTITKIERGKEKVIHQNHNIWVNLGREYLPRRITRQLSTPAPHGTPFSEETIRFIGIGTAGSVARATDPTTTTIETAVLVSSTDFLAELAVPPTFPLFNIVKFTRLFDKLDITYPTPGPDQVDVSEIGLYLSSKTPTISINTLVAYDFFPAIPKTRNFQLRIDWELRF